MVIKNISPKVKNKISLFHIDSKKEKELDTPKVKLSRKGKKKPLGNVANHYLAFIPACHTENTIQMKMAIFFK